MGRIEHGLAVEGGFAMITGAPGLGKSVIGRLSARHLEGRHLTFDSARDIVYVCPGSAASINGLSAPASSIEASETGSARSAPTSSMASTP